MYHIELLTSDPRFLLVSEALRERGYPEIQNNDKSGKKRLSLFSPRADHEEICKAIKDAAPGSIALVGRASTETKAFCQENKILLIPLLEDKRYLSENAIATAEGVLAEAVLKCDRILSQLCVLVCGYGNCGKEIARLLWLCGCEVWVYSRERGEKKAAEDGFNTVNSLKDGVAISDLVINTVEAPIFPPAVLDAFPSGCRLFQVATGFSGLCAEELSRRGVLFYPLPALPARCAPLSEADTILSILLPILEKERDER